MPSSRPEEYKPVFQTSKYQNPINYTMSPAALRARRPFIVKNALTALGFFSFAAGVYFYSLNALVQDDFADVPIPPISDEKLAELKKNYEEDKKAIMESKK